MRKLLAPMAAPMAIGSALAVACFSTSLPAHAQDAKLAAQVAEDPAEADAHFAAGDAAYARGEFTTASDEFEAAYRLSGRVEILRNIYLAHRDAGEPEIALIALRRYVNEAPDAPDHAEMAAELERLEAPTTETAPVEAAPVEAAPAAPPRDQTGITVAWILSGVGAATILAATAVGFSAEGTQSSLDDRCGPLHTMCPTGFEADRDRGVTLSLVADVLGIGGAAILGTGIALLFLFQEEDEAPPVAASCGPEGCMATVRGSF